MILNLKNWAGVLCDFGITFSPVNYEKGRPDNFKELKNGV